MSRAMNLRLGQKRKATKDRLKAERIESVYWRNRLANDKQMLDARMSLHRQFMNSPHLAGAAQ